MNKIHSEAISLYLDTLREKIKIYCEERNIPWVDCPEEVLPTTRDTARNAARIQRLADSREIIRRLT